MAFKPSKIKKHNVRHTEVKLNLTSMMDMFTIILVFLLKQYATSGQLISPSDYLKLPTSTVEQPPEVGLDVVVSQQMILLNGEKIAALEDVINNNPAVVENGIITPLRDRMRFYSSQAKQMEVSYGVKFSGKVTIEGDKELQYSELVKVMRTCGSSDYPNLRLLVYLEGD